MSDFKYNPISVSDIEANDLASTIDELIKNNGVIIFSKSTCAFCFEMKRTLASYGVNFAVFEIDKSSKTSEIQAHLKTISGISTVPNTFVNGKSIGGCTDCKQLEMDGKLLPLIGDYIGDSTYKAPSLSANGVLWFPEITNNNVVRVSGILGNIVSALLVIFWNRPPTKWCILAFAIDFWLRFTFGATHSVIGMTATVLATRFKPAWAPGPPKQFASLCGLIFTFGAAVCALCDERVGAAVWIAGLWFATGLEGWFGFCFGCFVFGIAVQLGICPKEVYRPYINLLKNRKFAYNYTFNEADYPAAESQHVLQADQTVETPVDLIRKDRLETEYKLRDVNVIKHARLDLFAIPLTVATLAYCFQQTGRYAATKELEFGTEEAFMFLAVLSVILCGAIFTLYFIRFCMYPKKCLKEWENPTFGNMWSAFTICLTLYGMMYMHRKHHGGITLVWIGAIGQMIITILRICGLIFDRIVEENINASIIMGPVGNFISALAFAEYRVLFDGSHLKHVNYLHISRLWFGVAALFAIVFFTITFRKAMSDHHSDGRVRFLNWVWLAMFSIVGPAAVACSDQPSLFLFQSMWGIALFFYVVLGLGWLRGHFTYEKDLSIWIMPFAHCAFCLNTIQYYSFWSVDDNLFHVLTIISLVSACATTSVCFLSTLTMLFDLSLFKPRPKWGPANFMKLTHEMFRFAIPRLTESLANLSGKNEFANALVLEELDSLFAAFDEHSRHEDHVLFPAVRRFFPKLEMDVEEEHHRCHEPVNQMAQLISNYHSDIKNGKSAADVGPALVQSLLPLFKAWGDVALPHLRREEKTFTVVVRKYFPIEMQTRITRESYMLTSASQWAKILPFTVANLPHPVWKVRFVRTFIWADPNLAQQIGLQLYNKLDVVEWNFLSAEIPEIVPRGLSAWKRIY